MINWKDIEFSTPDRISKIYHYQRFERDWIEALVNERRIRFSAPMNFNDPWDCRPCYNKSIVDDPEQLKEQVAYFKAVHKKWHPEIPDTARNALASEWLSKPETVKNAIDQSSQDMAKAIHEKYRVYCLASKPDCQLMWAHYAASHTGICLEFSTQNDVFCSAFKVEYLSEYPTLLVSEKHGLTNILPLITKAEAWAYENEYRLISEEEAHASAPETLKTFDGFFTVPCDSLQSIIMGCRITADDQEWLENFVKKSNTSINLKKTTPIPDKYELMLIDI